MLRLSFSIGRIMGVDVRLHLSFFVLFAAALAYGAADTGHTVRGFGLFAALLFAVLVRETARCIAAAFLGMRLRALFLLPVGGIMAFAPQEAAQPSLRPIMIAAPLANFGMGLLILGLSYASAPGVKLLSQPWISPAHVLRSFVWMQFMIAIVNLLPTATLPTRQMLRMGGSSPAQTPRPAGAAFSLLTGVGIALLLAGLVLPNVALLLLGGLALLLSQVKPQTSAESNASDDLRVDEVMLTEFTLLSSSDTLRGALERTVHSTADVFPVIRGDRLVGSVARQTLAEQLQLEGDSYVQGAMSRNLQVADPTEPLVTALRRAGAQGASEFIPVAQNGRVLGLLTPQTLRRAVHQVKQTRPPTEERVPR
jgi:CBS domain-containing protein